MSDLGHDSPESAAMTGFPEAHCRAVASRVRGDDAYVLLNTGSRTQPYLYGVNCTRRHGRWLESGSSDIPGWEQTGHDPDVGTLSFWGEATNGAEAVRVAFEGDLIDEPVREGAYLLVWWRVPQPSEWPRLVAFRIGGAWSRRSESMG